MHYMMVSLRHKILHQVEDLTDLLHRTNQTMAENEFKLAFFHDISRSKSRQSDMVCGLFGAF